MPDTIKGFQINGEIHRVDYEYLENKPEIPDITSLTDSVDSLNNRINAFQSLVTELSNRIDQLSDRIDQLENDIQNSQHITANVNSSKLSLFGSSVNVIDDKLCAINGTVSDNKLIL